MDEGRCRGCGATEPAGANFCSYCGVPFAAEYIELGQTTELADKPVGPGNAAKVLVPLAVVGLLAVAGVAVFAGAGDNQAALESEGAEQTVSSTPTTAVLPSDTDLAASIANPTLPPNGRVDPTRLPGTNATHLAVANGESVHFLNMETGTWSTVDTGRELAVWGGSPRGVSNGIDAFGDGVLVQTKPNGRLLHVSVDGETSGVASGSGSWLLGVHSGLAFVQESRFAASNTHVAAYDADGQEQYRVELPQRSRVPGVTSSGLVVIQAGSGIYVAGPSQNSFLATGTVSAVVNDSVLVYDCNENLECTTELVDSANQQSRTVDLPAGRIENLTSGDLLVHVATGSPQRYRLLAGDLVRIDLNETAPVGTMGSARDSGGTWASVGIDRIDFTQFDGAPRSTIEFDVGPCCGPFGITFLTL